MDECWDSYMAFKLSMMMGCIYVELSDADMEGTNTWRIKPKLHMVQEMLEFQSKELGNPRGFWEYLDEDFVGSIAKLAMRKGGANTHFSAP